MLKLSRIFERDQIEILFFASVIGGIRDMGRWTINGMHEKNE